MYPNDRDGNSSLDDHWVARLGALRRGSNLLSPHEQVRVISHIFIHPGYIDTGFVNDISVLRMEDPVRFTDYIRPVCLPPPNAEIRDGRLCTVIGWGQLYETGRVFRKINFKIETNHDIDLYVNI